jgi:putative acetyltransferase
VTVDLPRMPLTTESLVLRRFVPRDVEAVYRLSTEAGARRWLPSQVYRDRAHAASVLEYLIESYATPGDPRRGPYVLAVLHRSDAALIGHVGFSPFDGEVEIGFAIGERYQRRGLATEAIVAASAWALRSFGLAKILGVTAAANLASKRTLERAGFAHERDTVMNFQGTEQPVAIYACRPGSRPDAGPGTPAIRRFQDADLDRVLGLWERASRIAHPFLDDDFLRRERRAIAEVFMPRSETWVYLRAGVVVGFISLIGNEIGGLFVDPPAQRQGIGRALVDHARGRRDELEVEVFKANPIGCGFYEGYGFALAGERRDEETGQAVLRLRLDDDDR